jgi:tripartite-type tricarboxylate transporter receptor subunit TctC
MDALGDVMLKLPSATRSVIAALIVSSAGTASGQNYPNKPIRILTSEAGGGNDFGARLVAQELTANLGQQVIVENRPSSTIGDLGARASPDGYTLFVAGTSVVLGPLLRESSYDPVRDFSAITMLARAPNVLVVHPSVAAKSVKELIALARSRPGELNVATGGTGSSAHLAAELFNAMAGVNIVRINYKGTGPALNDIIAGQVQLMFAAAAGVATHIKSGRLRALAVGTAEPSRLTPDLPTVAATLPGYESSAISAVFVPARTPVALINRLNREIVRAINRESVKEKLLGTGVEPVGNSPSELARMIKAEITRMGKVIKDAGIRVQ